jgi:hypothetical protein
MRECQERTDTQMNINDYIKECRERTDNWSYISKEMEKFPMPNEGRAPVKYWKRKIRIHDLILDKIYFTDTNNITQLKRIYWEEQELMKLGNYKKIKNDK